jgi:hypothetical protein
MSPSATFSLWALKNSGCLRCSRQLGRRVHVNIMAQSHPSQQHVATSTCQQLPATLLPWCQLNRPALLVQPRLTRQSSAPAGHPIAWLPGRARLAAAHARHPGSALQLNVTSTVAQGSWCASTMHDNGTRRSGHAVAGSTRFSCQR